jgi:hypothetical protein
METTTTDNTIPENSDRIDDGLTRLAFEAEACGFTGLASEIEREVNDVRARKAKFQNMAVAMRRSAV